jgi:hypothetical protein
MAVLERYIVEIASRDGGYQGTIYQGNRMYARNLRDLQLGPDAEIVIKSQSYRLDALVDALIGYQANDLQTAYDERGQLEIGRHLYHQLFGDLNPAERQQLRERTLDVRIVTEDEHIARLPWVLLADGGVFLSATGWSVALALRVCDDLCELPPSPRMLVVAPQPVGVEATRAERHLEALELLLSGTDPRHVRGQFLNVVTTWEAFVREVERFKPDIVYYYGHGIGDRHVSRLVFARQQGNQRYDVPMIDVAGLLRDMPGRPPRLIYLNCCLGDAGGLLGAGQAFGEAIPAVISNRTVAHIDAAQAQGMAFWRSVVIDGIAPHIAVAEMRRRIVSMGLSHSNERWMTPVLHCHYGTWTSNPPKAGNQTNGDPHWRLKLDRVRQFSQVFFLTSQMLWEQRPRSLAYVWYGQPGQGVDLFHQRLTVELQEKLPDTSLVERLPEWPPVPSWESYKDMMLSAFEVATFDHIPGRIRELTHGVSDRQILVYVRHAPVRSSQSSGVITPRVLKSYLEWWDEYFIKELGGQVFAVLGVSFVVGKPTAFHRALNKRGVIDMPLDRTLLWVLDEMDRVTKKDLIQFLQTHNVRVPLSHRDRVLDEVLETTQGNYDLTLEALKDLVARVWPIVGETESEGYAEEDEDDYD